MDICEKIAYIKGLAEGLGLNETTKEGKVLTAIIDLLGDITEEICDIEDGCDSIAEQLDAVDEDLASVEEIVYDDEDCDCDCDCDCCDDECLEVECPACENTVCIGFDEIDDNGEAECPACGAILEFEIEEEDEIEE